MSKARKNKVERVATPSMTDIIKGVDALPIEELSLLQQTLPQVLQAKLGKSLASTNVEEVLRAQYVLEKANKEIEQGKMKAFFFDPNGFSNSGRGFKEVFNGLPFTVLQRMGEVFIVKAVVNTRIEQVQNFLKFSTDEQKEGFTIRRKKSLFEDANAELSPEEKKIAEYIVYFLEHGGNTRKWDNVDTFQDFVRKILRDSLTLDQLAFELVRNDRFELDKFKAIDASLVRYLDAVDPKFRERFEPYKFKGYYPMYAMIWDGNIFRDPRTGEYTFFYPWQLGFGVRNKGTNIYKNGYGTSELETLVEIITWVLWGMQYNGNFFKQGSQPKGFINVKNSNIDNNVLNNFRQIWTQTMMGVQNSHRVPVLQGIDLEWIDLQHTNRDMEFNEWVKFLIIMVCSVYRIDPSELGFNFEGAARIFGQDGQRERLAHSREKGLTPLLVFLQNVINKYIVEEIDSDLEFAFTGIEIQDERSQVELDKIKLESGMVAMEDIFEKYSGRPFDEKKDTILNSVFQQAQAQKMYGGGMNDTVDEYTGEEDMTFTDEPAPDEEYVEEGLTEEQQAEKSYAANPILHTAMEYIGSHWGKK